MWQSAGISRVPKTILVGHTWGPSQALLQNHMEYLHSLKLPGSKPHACNLSWAGNHMPSTGSGCTRNSMGDLLRAGQPIAL